MKKTSSRRRPGREEMRREYQFDYRKSRPNRFAPLMKGGTIAVVIDPEVLDVFPDGTTVNQTLRALAPLLRRHRQAAPKRRTA